MQCSPKKHTHEVVDRVAELGTAESLAQRWARAWPGASVVPVSAKRGDVDHVLSRSRTI